MATRLDTLSTALRARLDPDRITTACWMGFAVWTLLCHAVVFAGGSLDVLLLAAAGTTAALVAWRLLRRRDRRRPAGQATGGPLAAPDPRPRIAGWLGLAAGAGLAVWIAALAGVPWHSLWLPSAVIVAVAGGIAWIGTTADAPAPERRRRGVVWALAVVCAAVTLTANRPDIDDCFYLCMAQSSADEPSAPLLAHDHLHGLPDLPLFLPTYRAHSIEVLGGALARLTSVPAIVWHHVVLPPIAAILAVFAISRIASLIAPGRWLSVTLATVAVLLAVGNAHAWYGNFAFVRLQQGKAIFATAIVPLIIAYGVELGRRPSRRGWLRLAAVQVAAVGSTATALWVAPMVAVLAVVAAIRPDRRGLRTLALTLATTAYPLLLAVGFSAAMRAPGVAPELGTSRQQAAATQPAESDRRGDDESRPSFDVAGQLDRSATFVLGDARLRLAVLGLLLWGWWPSPEPSVRRLHLVFTSFGLVVLVDPVLVELLATRVTGVFTYWRIAWVVPAPLLAGCLLTSPVALVRGWRGPVLAASLTAAVLAGVTTHPVFGGASGARVGTPGLKVTEEYEVARALVDRVPPGSSVIAPREVSPWITTFPHHPFPAVARREYLGVLHGAVSNDQILRRVHASVAAREPGRHRSADRQLLRLVDDEHTAGVVIAARQAGLAEVEQALRERDYHADWSGLGYRIWIRGDLGRHPAG